MAPAPTAAWKQARARPRTVPPGEGGARTLLGARARPGRRTHWKQAILHGLGKILESTSGGVGKILIHVPPRANADTTPTPLDFHPNATIIPF